MESLEACWFSEDHWKSMATHGILLGSFWRSTETRGILLGCMGNGNLSVLDMVVEKCLFYDVFLKVVFKKHLNYNEKWIFVISGKQKRENQLIASELYSLEKFV